MSHKTIAVVILYSISAVSLCSCQKSQKREFAFTPDTQPSLQTIHDTATDIVQTAPGGDWVRVLADIDVVNNAWKDYLKFPIADKDSTVGHIQGRLTEALVDLRRAAAVQHTSGTMKAANNISGAAMDLLAFYNRYLPSDIGRLAAIERQIILNSSREDFDAASINLSNAYSVWQRVKPSIINEIGLDTAAEFEANLNAQQNAINAQDASRLNFEARNSLKLLGDMMQAFES